MIKEKYEYILKGIDVRNNLIELKSLLKEESEKNTFKYMLAGDYSTLTKLFDSDDPKIRKSTAAILGELKDDCLKDVIYSAYEKEDTLFVRTAYLKALKKLDYTSLLPALRDKREALLNYECSEDELKHFRDEIAEINRLIEDKESHRVHQFTGYKLEYDIVLTANPCFVKHLKESMDVPVKALKSGVRLVTDNIKEVAKIRTYNELLFCLNDLVAVEGEPYKAALQIAKGNLSCLLEKSHSEGGAFRYRVELRGIKDRDEQKAFAVAFSKELDRLLAGNVVNDTSNYEIEIRLVRNKEGKFLPFLKLMTFHDERFDYREGVLSVSMQPHNAAVMMELAKEYMEEDARVLDPFCGVGTLLVERRKIMDAATLYGIDIYGKAILMARDNAKKAGIIVNYINRDYKDFTHEYKFDEIITELPYISAKHDRSEIRKIYDMFFKKSLTVLRDGSRLIICSDEPDMVKEQISRYKEYTLVKSDVLSEKAGKNLYVIKFK